MTKILRIGRNHALRLLVVAGFGLALGACSKCDVPDFSSWLHGTPTSPPHSCHGGPPVQ